MKDLKLYFIIGSLLLGLYLVLQYNKPKPVNWQATFSRTDKNPFGTYIIRERLTDIFPDAQIRNSQDPPYVTLTEKKPGKGCFLIVAASAQINKYDFKQLQKYMEKGNSVLVASYYPGSYLSDTLKNIINSEVKRKKHPVGVYFLNKKLDPHKQYYFDRDIGNQYFSSFDTTRATVLGRNSQGHPNFIKYRFGKGNLYLLPSPYFFTNYNMLKPEGAEYAEKVFSYLPGRGEVIWDDFSSMGTEQSESLVQVLLTYPQLKWAYYIALFSLLLFVVYEMKRRQRIIPVLDPLTNSTTEFVKVVGQLYYQQRDNSNIARKKMSYWLEDIRSRYGLRTNQLDKEFAEVLEKKSGAQKWLINEILEQSDYLKSENPVSDAQLIKLNKNIELFYKQSA